MNGMKSIQYEKSMGIGSVYIADLWKASGLTAITTQLWNEAPHSSLHQHPIHS